MTHLGIVALALALLIAPIAAHAQQAGKVYSIGYLGLGSSFEEPNRTAFSRGLQEHGWIEGQNFVSRPDSPSSSPSGCARWSRSWFSAE